MKQLFIIFAMMLGWCLPVMGDDAMPKDALWTIYCKSFSGSTRVQEAKSVKDSLVRATDMKYWHVIHLNEESALYYGYYRGVSADDEAKYRKDADRAQADLKTIRLMQDADGQKVFAMVGFVPIPQPGNEGPREWDLSNLPADKYWTLFVGIYKDNPDRKKVAVQAVKALRDDGKEAYYLHDETSSLICIGSWPRGAIKEQQTDDASVTVADRDVEVMAVNVPLPANMPREFVTPEGKKVRVFAPSIEVKDPSLQSAMDRYPDFLTNGQWLGRESRDPKTGKPKVVGHRSQLLIIPRKNAGPAQTNHGVQDALRQLQPDAAVAPKGAGSLRSLED